MCEEHSADSFTALSASTERRLNQERKHLTKRLIKAQGLDNISPLKPNILSWSRALILRVLLARAGSPFCFHGTFALQGLWRQEQTRAGTSRTAERNVPIHIKGSLIIECNPLSP
jgi:hypothetical protein